MRVKPTGVSRMRPIFSHHPRDFSVSLPRSLPIAPFFSYTRTYTPSCVSQRVSDNSSFCWRMPGTLSYRSHRISYPKYFSLGDQVERDTTAVDPFGRRWKIQMSLFFLQVFITTAMTVIHSLYFIFPEISCSEKENNGLVRKYESMKKICSRSLVNWVKTRKTDQQSIF